MRVALRRHAMRRPAGVRDADGTVEAVFLRATRKLRDAAGAAQTLETSVHHRDSRGVVAAVFEALQTFEQDRDDVTARDGAYDAAHDYAFLRGRFQPSMVDC